MCLAVVLRYMITLETGTADVVRWHIDESGTVARQLVVHLAIELEPALIEDRVVQVRLGPNECSWRRCLACLSLKTNWKLLNVLRLRTRMVMRKSCDQSLS